MDLTQILQSIAPVAGSLASGGHQAAFMRGFQRRQAQIEADRQKQEQDDQNRRKLGADATLKALEHLQSLSDPMQAQQFVNVWRQTADAVGADPSAFDTYTPLSGTDTRVKELETLLAGLEKGGFNLDDLASSGAAVVTKDGTKVPVSTALTATRTRPVDAKGNPVAKPKKADAAPSLQRETVMVNGKPVLANYNPKSGTYTGLDGQPITNAQPYQKTQETGDDDADVEAIANAIMNGSQPPTLTGLYRNTKAIRGTLARKGFNLAEAENDWKATQRRLASLNGTQQTRLIQAVDTANHSLDVIEDLAKQWDGGRFPTLNKARLALAKGGALGPKAQEIATLLDAQISDVTSELGNVYMGGNSPTDHALSLAKSNLSADWTKDQLLAALKLARTNLQIRSNSMRNTPIAGASANNPYAPVTQTPKRIGRFDVVVE